MSDPICVHFVAVGRELANFKKKLLQKFHHLVGMPFIALDIPTYHPLIASS
jgi:hypothetical protein